MPAAMGKSGLGAKLGDKLKKGFEEHKGDDLVLGGGGDLPAGIENGIAQLVECKFDQYKSGDLSGEYFFYAAAVVLAPSSIEILDEKTKKSRTIKIEGRRTQIGPEPICDTPKKGRKTVGDHVAWVLNEMRKLGIDTKDMDVNDLEPTAAALKESGIKIQFRTWIGKPTTDFPNPRVNHEWQGAVEETSEESSGVVDETGGGEAGTEGTAGTVETPADEIPFGSSLDDLGVEAENGNEAAAIKLAERAEELLIPKTLVTNAANWAAVVKLIVDKEAENEAKAKPATTPAKKGPGAKPKAAPAAPPAEPTIAELGTKADEGDEEAGAKLSALCETAGLDVNQYGTWSEIAEALAAGTEVAGDPGEIPPAVEDVHFYKIPVKGPGGKVTPGKKPTECQVIAVDAENKTVDLKNLTDGKTTYKAVPWSDLGE